MHRQLAGLGLCLMLLTGAACSKDEPVAQPPSVSAPSSGVPTTPIAAPGLPTGTALTAVDVTRPATPTSIDPQLLPPSARRASAMAGLTTDQRICIDDTIYETVQADATIADDQGRLAGVMGGAMALCGGDAFARSTVEGLKQALSLTDEQAACVESTMAGDQQVAARFLGAAATADLSQLADALESFESTCGFTLPG